MSIIVDDYLECLSRDYGPRDKHICHDCISDYALKSYIKENGELQTCSYCKRRKKSILLEELMSPIMDGIQFMYSRAIDELPVDEGEFVGSTYSTEDIFSNTIADLIGASSEEIIDDLVSLISNETWCDANPFEVSEDEAEFNEWQRFCKLVKEKMRYVFFEAKNEDSLAASPIDILNYISSSIEKINLTTTINKNTKMYRCRMSEDEHYFTSLSDFCPPPSEKAHAGRMNAQGIAVLYLTLEPETARSETDSQDKHFASVASFRVEDSLVVLDLTKLNMIRVPSIFDAEGRPKISAIRFLKRFNEQISQKVSLEQVDYVPTQIVTEYFRFLNIKGTQKYQGILYNSAKNPDGKCLVLFLSRQEVLDGKYGIHIIPRQTRYFRKKYDWISEEEKAKTLYIKQLLAEVGRVKISDISKETGMSKATIAQIFKKLQKQGLLDKPVYSIESSISEQPTAKEKEECVST